jgi:hypothetical protein
MTLGKAPSPGAYWSWWVLYCRAAHAEHVTDDDMLACLLASYSQALGRKAGPPHLPTAWARRGSDLP